MPFFKQFNAQEYNNVCMIYRNTMNNILTGFYKEGRIFKSINKAF